MFKKDIKRINEKLDLVLPKEMITPDILNLDVQETRN